MERISSQSLDSSLSLVSTLILDEIILCLNGLLLEQNFLDLFLLLTEIFILKLEHIDPFKIKIKSIILLHHFDLSVCLFLQLHMLLCSLSDEFINIDYCAKLDFINLLLHDRSSSVNQNFFVLFLGQVFVFSLVSLLNDDSVELQLDGLPFYNLLFNRIF